MKKNEFIEKLQSGLCGLPREDIDRSVEFYSEIIDDKIIYKVNGLSVISIEYISVNSESETLVFFTNKMLLQNKKGCFVSHPLTCF